MNRCGSFPLLFSAQSLFSIWTNLERSGKIPGAPTRRWGEWIWLTRPSGLHRNSPQGLNISSNRVFDQIRDPEIPITLRPRVVDILLLLLCNDLNFKWSFLRIYISHPIYLWPDTRWTHIALWRIWMISLALPHRYFKIIIIISIFSPVTAFSQKNKT